MNYSKNEMSEALKIIKLRKQINALNIKNEVIAFLSGREAMINTINKNIDWIKKNIDKVKQIINKEDFYWKNNRVFTLTVGDIMKRGYIDIKDNGDIEFIIEQGEVDENSIEKVNYDETQFKIKSALKLKPSVKQLNNEELFNVFMALNWLKIKTENYHPKINNEEIDANDFIAIFQEINEIRNTDEALFLY